MELAKIKPKLKWRIIAIQKGTTMKYLIASLIALSFTAPVYAGTYKTIETGSRDHKVNVKKCWQATGNWVGGKSFTSCEFSSGKTFTKRVYVCDKNKS